MAFYRFEKKKPEIVGGIGDGTKTSPWYWYGKTAGQTVSVNNAGADSSDNYRLYFRVKLKGGTDYSIGQTKPGGGDGRIKLFDSAMSQVFDNDDSSGSIAGVSCSDRFVYRPSADGIFYIGAGAYSTATGDFTVAMDPAPEQEPLPEIKYRYPTSSGFDDFGYPIAYDSANEAGCGLLNSWQSPDNLTANDSNPAFILNQSSQFNSNTTAFRAFDGSLNLGQYSSRTYNSADFVDTAWITIQLGEANGVNYLKLVSAGYSNSCQPADFNLEYSDDGSTWTPCLEVRGLTQAWWNTPSVGTEHEWAVASSGKHKHYRLNMLTRVANASYNIQRMEIGVK